eukprot:2600583-Rhodomonas_salina.3
MSVNTRAPKPSRGGGKEGRRCLVGGREISLEYGQGGQGGRGDREEVQEACKIAGVCGGKVGREKGGRGHT